MKNPFWKWAVLIFIAAFAFRFWLASHDPLWSGPLAVEREGFDSADYEQIAHNLVEGHGFSVANAPPYERTFKRAPGYPLFLTAFYRVFGYSHRPVLTAQAILGALACVLLLKMGIWLGDIRTGVVAALMNTFNFSGAHYAAKILTEEPAIFEFILTGFLFMLAVRRRSIFWAACGGFSLGIVLLSKTALAPMTPFLIFLGACSGWKWKERWKACFAAMFCTGLVLVPWFLWTQTVTGNSSPGMIGGMTLHARTFERGIRADLIDPRYNEEYYMKWSEMKKAGASEAEVVNYFKQIAVSTIQKYPGRYLFGALIELDAFLGLRFFFPFSPRKFEKSQIGSLPIFFLKGTIRLAFYLIAIGGMILAMRQKKAESLFLILILPVFIAVHIFTAYSGYRYAEPIIPFFILFFSLRIVPNLYYSTRLCPT